MKIYITVTAFTLNIGLLLDEAMILILQDTQPAKMEMMKHGICTLGRFNIDDVDKKYNRTKNR